MGDLYNPFPRLPKNIRQIGERDQTVRLYLEDYVNTYLKRLFPKGGQDLRAGVLLGRPEERDGLPFLFVDGAMEVEDITEPGEKVQFTEQAWRKTYQAMEQMFPKRVVLGWFLCGAPGCGLSPLNYWKEHGKYFAGKNQLMYLNSGLDGEEAVYVASEDGFCRLRGYCVYYERNQMMQDYMILRKDVRRVETGAGDPVIRDFRQRMEENKNQVTARRGTVRVLGGLCTALGILVLAGGVTMVNNYEKMKEMEAVLTSVLPAGMLNEDASDRLSGSGKTGLTDSPDKAGQASQVIVEDIAGRLGLTAGEDENDGSGIGGSPQTVPAVNEGQMVAGAGGAAPAGGEAAGGTDPASGGVSAGDGSGGVGTASGGTTGETTLAAGGMNQAAGGMNQAAGGMNQASGGMNQAAGGTNQASGGTNQASGGTNQASGGTAPAADSASGGASAASGEAGTAEGAGSGEERAPAREVLAGQSLYLVQPGDTLYGICLERYGNGSLMEQICELNGLENEDTITAGENLILP